MNNDNCYITCSGRNDGVGAQLQGILSTILFCNDMGINYVHSPFVEIAHKPESQINWENEWESFFNIGRSEISMSDISGLSLHTVHIADFAGLPMEKKPDTLFVVPHCHRYADMFPDNYLKIKHKLLEKYNNSSKEKYKSYIYPFKINIAVHIRRGDVCLEKYPNRYIDNERIARLLAGIQSALSGFRREISINIFSEGLIGHFQELNGNNVNFYLDHCLFTTFHNMVAADILIMGKSSFSYTAALFSNGVKLYQPFWHKPQKDWVVISEMNQVDENDLKNKVFNKLCERGRLKSNLYAQS